MFYRRCYWTHEYWNKITSKSRALIRFYACRNVIMDDEALQRLGLYGTSGTSWRTTTVNWSPEDLLRLDREAAEEIQVRYRKTRSWLNGFSWFWRRWRALDISSSMTPKSWKSVEILLSSWTIFDSPRFHFSRHWLEEHHGELGSRGYSPFG